MAIVPLYLKIQSDLHLEHEGQVTLLVTVLNLAYILPSYPMGVLADRVSRKKLLALGLAINGVGFIALSVSHSYALAILSVAISGFGGSFYHPAATALVARLFPKTTGRALGLVAIGASAGFFISPIYSGWRAASTGNWRIPILEMGIAGLVVSILFYWLADEEAATIKSERRTIPTGGIFPTKILWLYFLLAGFLFSLRDFAGSGMGTLTSLFLQHARGLDLGSTGTVLSAIFVASAVSNPIFGRLSDTSRMRWCMLLLMVAMVIVAIFPRVSQGHMFYILLAYGFFFLASYPIVEAALMQAVPDEARGRVFGLFMTMGGLGGSISHWFMGVAVNSLGEGAHSVKSYYPIYGMLASLICLSLLGLPCLHAIRRREGLDFPSPALPADAPILPQNVTTE
jgi:FSR family fosmidomycin resistance protein-like MFS transporter